MINNTLILSRMNMLSAQPNLEIILKKTKRGFLQELQTENYFRGRVFEDLK